MDGVTIPLKMLVPTEYPTDATILQSLLVAVDGLAVLREGGRVGLAVAAVHGGVQTRQQLLDSDDVVGGAHGGDDPLTRPLANSCT